MDKLHIKKISETLSIYGWLKFVLKEFFFNMLIYVICLINVIVVIHVRCHWVCMGS